MDTYIFNRILQHLGEREAQTLRRGKPLSAVFWYSLFFKLKEHGSPLTFAVTEDNFFWPFAPYPSCRFVPKTRRIASFMRRNHFRCDNPAPMIQHLYDKYIPAILRNVKP